VITNLPRVAIATRDFAGTVSTFRDALGMPVVDLSAQTAGSLGAKLAMCVPRGGSNIELMSPANPAAPLSQSLERFLARRGEGLFALMLEAPDPNAEAEVLRERGLDVLPLMAGAGGRDVHPRSTHGVLIRVYPSGSFQAASEQVQKNQARTLGLSGVVRVVVAVRDLEHALKVYGRSFALDVRTRALDAPRGVAAAICAAPAGGQIELVEPTDPGRPFAAAIAEHSSRAGEGMFALVLQATDPAAVGSALALRGLTVGPFADQPGVLEIDPGGLFGARVLIEPSGSAEPGRQTAARG
jgi:catechol 2,3-dioxygenase-like lactoylglutathione lyase family enzyme